MSYVGDKACSDIKDFEFGHDIIDKYGLRNSKNIDLLNSNPNIQVFRYKTDKQKSEIGSQIFFKHKLTFFIFSVCRTW